MRWFPKVAVSLAWIVLATQGLAAKKDEPKTKDGETKKEDAKVKSGDSKKDAGKKDKKKEIKKSDDAPAPDERGKISLPILKDHPAKGLKIPYYGLDGKLQMTFNIGVATRLDDDHVQMGELFLETYEEDGSPAMMIQLPTSVIDVNTKVLSTDTSVTIRRSDFELTGKRMEFNTETKQGKLAGDVRMLIYNIDEETSAPSKQEANRVQ